MKLNPDQLASYLQQNANQNISQDQGKGNEPKAFLLTGDEPYQLMEAADTIRAYAKQMGYVERDILHADNSFKWNELAGVSNSLSLFSEKKFIDLRIEMKTPGKVGSQAIRDYMENVPDDKILLIQVPKLAAAARNSAWVKAIEKQGIVIQIWDLSAPQTMAWVSKKMREMGMRATPDAVRLLTERVEGNLLAAFQEISKLKLLSQNIDDQSSVSQNMSNQNTRAEIIIDEEQVLAAVSDSSRFSIFDLSNAVMAGDLTRIQHIHHNLKEEGVPIQLVLWALSDLSRQLYSGSFNLNNGMSASQIVAKMPRPKQRPFQTALQRMRSANWTAILKKNSDIDRLSKGQSEIANKGLGRVWSELLELALMLAGAEVMVTEAV